MLICMDYDETYTEDPNMWDRFIELAKQSGHDVMGASMRYEKECDREMNRLIRQCEVFIFTGRKAKRGVVEEAGYYPSVWVDDSPHWIDTDSN